MTDEPRAALDAEVDAWMRNGYRVESRTDRTAAMVKGQRPSHLLHFFIGLLTLSLWWFFVWLPIILFGGEKRRVISVDDTGVVKVSR